MNTQNYTREEMEEKVKEMLDQLFGTTPVVSPSIPVSAKETHVGLVLDSSGSMSHLRTDTIGAYNESLKTLKGEEAKLGRSTASLIVFNSFKASKKVHSCVPISTVQPIDNSTYYCGGNTALYDAIGEMILALEPLDVPDKDVAFLITVWTDGYENDSHEWSGNRLREKITQLQAKGNWTFTFSGANIDVNQIGGELNIPIGNLNSWAPTAQGMSANSMQYGGGLQRFSALRADGRRSAHTFYDNDTTTLKTETRKVTALGNRNVVCGGDIKNSVINTGDTDDDSLL